MDTSLHGTISTDQYSEEEAETRRAGSTPAPTNQLFSLLPVSNQAVGFEQTHVNSITSAGLWESKPTFEPVQLIRWHHLPTQGLSLAIGFSPAPEECETINKQEGL